MLRRRPSVRSSLALLLLLVGHLLAASPLLGGTVYVAFAGDGEIEGLSLQTFLVVTNPTDELKFVALDFRPAAVFEPGVINGEQPGDDLEPEVHGIPPGQTRMFTGLSGDLDTVGLLEVTGDDVLVVDARLQVTPPSGPPRIVQLPVVTSDNAQPRNEVHVLPGWYRDENLRTSYGLINLADASNQCTVQLRALLGDNLTEPAVLTLEPSSMIFLTDPLGGIGIFSISESRLEVSCSEPSYSYVLVTDLSTGDIVRRGAAVDLASALGSDFGDDDTSDPGDPGDDPGGSGGGGGTPDGQGVIIETAPGLVRMRVPGLVHAPSRGNDRWIYRLDLPNLSTIDSMTATVRVRTGPWGALRVRPQHHLLQISNPRWGDGAWDFWVRPDRTDGVVQTGLLVTRGLNSGNEVVRGTMNGLPNNFQVSVNQNGRRLDGHGLSVTQGFPPRSGPLVIQLGANLGVSHDPKVPSYGWQWFDLEIEIRGR
jgi:hypothetical protein